MHKVKFFKVKVVPEGTYTTKVADVEERDGEYGLSLYFRFLITEGEFEGRNLIGVASYPQSAATTSKLYLWVRAIIGDDSEEFEPSNLVGRECQVKVAVASTEDNREMNRIVEVLPIQSDKKEKKLRKSA